MAAGKGGHTVLLGGAASAVAGGAGLDGALSALREATRLLEDACGPAVADVPSWEEKLSAVSAALRRTGGGGGGGGGTSATVHPQPALGGYLGQLAEAITSEPETNQVTFLPLGMGTRAVLNAVIASAVAAAPTKHVVLALAHGDQLRAELDLAVGVFAGGDFLYSFEQELPRCAVVVITAGLLLRLLKTGQYAFSRASLVVLRDAFTAIRNHPANTVLLGVLTSHLHSKHRPFDKQRQHLRKLCQSTRAALVLPRGAGLAAMEAALRRDPISLRPFRPAGAEAALAAALQAHCLTMWDILHQFGLNHFGKLLHLAAPPAGEGPGAGGGAGEAGGEGAGADAAAAAAAGRPASDGGGGEGSAAAGEEDAAAAAAEDAQNPLQHDWRQVETMLLHSVWHTDCLPSRGEHTRNPEALALMMHVLDCVRALRAGLELGPGACLRRLAPALAGLHSFLVEGIGGPLSSPLKARILEVAGQSALVDWVRAAGAAPLAAAMGGAERGAAARLAALEALLAELAGEGAAGAPAAGSNGEAEEGEGARSEEQGAQSEEQGAGPAERQKERQVAAAAAVRADQREARPVGQRRRRTVAVVAGSREARAALRGWLRASPRLAGAAWRELGAEGDGSTTAADTGAAPEEDAAALARGQEGQDAAAAGAAAAEGLEVLLLAQQDLPGAAAELAGVAAFVWHSAGDVMSASSHDLESPALFACHQLCAAARERRGGGPGGDGGGGGPPECYVLASWGQVRACSEAAKVDATLKAAMQMFLLGDVAFEEQLSRLAHAQAGAELEPQACQALEAVVEGLCGEAPAFTTTAVAAASPGGSPGDGGAREAAAGGDGSAGAAGAAAGPAEAAAAGAEAGASGQQGGRAGLLFRASVALPAASLPAERSLPAPAALPCEPFEGAPAPSEAAARASAALRALQALHSLGVVARYWPSRLLLAQHLLPRPQDPGQGQEQQGAACGGGGGGTRGAGEPAGTLPPSHFCNLCHVSATGGQAFDAHVRGFRHQRRLRQQAVLQQGESCYGGGYDSPTGSPSLHSGPHSSELTPLYCVACGAYCPSAQLLESHACGRRHLRHAAGLDSPAGAARLQQQQQQRGGGGGLYDGGGPPLGGGGGVPAAHAHARAAAVQQQTWGAGGAGAGLVHHQQLLVSPFYCSVCSMWATSEEQLGIHMMGKRHSRMLALQQAQGGGAGAHGGPPPPPPPHAAAGAVAFCVPQTPFGPVPHMLGPPAYMAGPAPAYVLAGGGMAAAAAGHGSGGGSMGGAAQQPAPGPAPPPQQPESRLPRCDLCNVVTPSQRHFSYHLQSERHLRRQQHAAAAGGGAGTAASGSPGGGGERPRGQAQQRHGDGGAAPAPAPGPAAPRGAGASPHKRRGSGGGWEEVEGGAEGEGLVCRICGIMATSELNLEDHYKGRRHLRNLQRLSARGVPVLPAEAAAAAGAGAPSDGATTVATVSVGGLQKQGSGVTVTAEGVLLGSTLISSGSLQRQPSGDIYADFPCVRVGDVLLPSSMDLRRFLEELQILDEGWEEGPAGAAANGAAAMQPAGSLPPIAEHEQGEESGAAALAGAGSGSSQEGGGGGGGGLQRSAPLSAMPDAFGGGEGDAAGPPGGGLRRASPFDSRSSESPSPPPLPPSRQQQQAAHRQQAGGVSRSQPASPRARRAPWAPPGGASGAGAGGGGGVGRAPPRSAPATPRQPSRFAHEGPPPQAAGRTPPGGDGLARPQLGWGGASPALVPLPADAAAYGMVPVPHGLYAHAMQSPGLVPPYRPFLPPGGLAPHAMLAPMQQQAAALQFAAAGGGMGGGMAGLYGLPLGAQAAAQAAAAAAAAAAMQYATTARGGLYGGAAGVQQQGGGGQAYGASGPRGANAYQQQHR
eukprot:scaffold13.g294.t1